MPTFRNRSSGQVVTVREDPSHLSGLARWERIEEGLSAPAVEPESVVDYVAPGVDPALPVVAYVEASQEAQADLAEARETAAAELEELNEALADTPARPADDAPRDEWLAYAKSQGKTDAELKGVKTTVIRGWFE